MVRGRKKVVAGARLLVLLLGVGLLTGAVYAATSIEQGIAERIKPVGSVCIEGEDCGAAVAATSSASAGGPRSGEEIYQQSCFVCHAAGVAGAPKLGDAAAWAPRIEAGMDSMMANAINGIRAMPPRGTCMDCSDEEIQLSIQYILDNSQ